MNTELEFIFDVLANKGLITKTPDIPELIRLLKQNRTVPYFYYQLQNFPQRYNTIKMQLKDEAVKYTLKTMHMEGVLKEVIEILNNESIDVIVLKGFALAATIYPQKHLRSMADIDILVPKNRFDEAKNTMLTAGASISGKANSSVMENIQHDFSVFYKGVLVELHFHIFPQNEKYYFNESLLWQHLTKVETDKLSFNTFDTGLTFFYLLHHFDRHAAFGLTRLSWLLDIALFYKTYNEKIIRDQLDYWINQSNGGNQLFYGLRVCNRFLGIDFTDFDIKPLSDKEAELYLEMCLKGKKKGVGSFVLLSRIKGSQSKIRYISKKLFPGKKYLIQHFKLKKQGLWILLLPVLYIQYLKKWIFGK